MAWRDQVARMDATLVEHFGDPTIYTSSSGQAAQPKGIFDDAFVHVDAGEAGVTSTGPAVFYRLVDLPTDPENDEPELVIAGVTYRVIDVQKDGQGGVMLRLHRV